MSNDFPVIGDEVTFTPASPHQIPVTGFVRDQIADPFGGIGFHLLSPLPDDPYRVIRVWLSRGTVAPTGRKVVADANMVVALAPKSTDLPYINAGDLATRYKRTEKLSRHLAWNAFVRDTILQPICRSEKLDAAEFFRMYKGA